MCILLHNSNKSIFNIQQFKAMQYKIVKTVLNVQKQFQTVLNSWGSYAATSSEIIEKGKLLCNIWNAVIY